MGRSGRPMTSHFIRPQRGELFTPLTNYVSVNRIISGLGTLLSSEYFKGNIL